MNPTMRASASNEPRPLQSLDVPEKELVLGLVAPVGARLDEAVQTLVGLLTSFTYHPEVVRLSDFLKDPSAPPPADAAARMKRSMENGTSRRRATERGDILALQAIKHIHETYHVDNKLPSTTAFILRSLKHQDEVVALRKVYGSGFFLLGINASEEERVKQLCEIEGLNLADATALSARDQSETDELGQQTRKVFELADFYVEQRHMTEQLKRILELLFGHPYIFPEPQEHWMHMAYAASLRSADLSRQVGAVVVSARGDLIGIGSNDVPKAFGGPYVPGPQDRRDFQRGGDPNKEHLNRIVEDVVHRLLGPEHLQEGIAKLERSLLHEITEYARAAHAEMDALLACARSGVSTRDSTLYCTTFPCHNCAKHIVAAGVRTVYYIEPYPKSRAITLHNDAIALDSCEDKVSFLPFIGVAPRRYVDLFAMKPPAGEPINRKISDKTWEFSRKNARLRSSLVPTTYIDREKRAIVELKYADEKAEKRICP